MKIAGVDEAGKGSVIGSMFVAGVMIEETSLRRLENMGVKDSKVISRIGAHYWPFEYKKFVITTYMKSPQDKLTNYGAL